MNMLAHVRINPNNGALKDDSALEAYFREFRSLQNAPIKLLELGVHSGGSLKIWEKFFPNGKIFGIDRRIAPELSGQKTIRYFQGEQQDTTFLDRIAKKFAPEGFDIIIDDCSHIGSLSKISFWHLYEKHLKPDGIYVIEDWLTGFLPEWEDGEALNYDPKNVEPEGNLFHGHQFGMVGFVKELVDELGRKAFFDPLPKASRNSRIAEMQFFEKQVFIYKGPRQAPKTSVTSRAPVTSKASVKSNAANAQDHYVTSLPTAQNALDIFQGEWSSKLPSSFPDLAAGKVPLFEDSRVAWFIDRLGGVEGKRVLELGPLEAGHTYMMERAGAASIVAIEANSRAYLKCLVNKEVLGLERARFLCGDFVEYLRINRPKVDVCLASGVLYHMTNPVELLSLMAEAASSVCLWTHYYDEQFVSPHPHLANQFTEHRSSKFNGFAHTKHCRFYGQAQIGWQGFCGGMEPTSVWLSKEDIFGALRQFGLNQIEIAFDDPSHPNGPSMALTAKRT